MKDYVNLLRDKVFMEGKTIKTKSWQGKKNPPPMIEKLNVSINIPMLENNRELDRSCIGDFPWAEEHFLERVSGEPLNPPPSHVSWLRKTSDFLEEGEKFSHSYPERMWSKGLHSGIRYNIADLSDLVKLLKSQPDTRQAYLPIFFPEDLSAANIGKRVPCTLGWHFIVRDGEMHCFYPIRSCDVVRHVHNDLYFANKLVIWLIDKTGLDVRPGILHFACTSLHAFESDMYSWKKGKLC